MLKIFSALLFSAVLAVTNPQSSGDITNSTTIPDSTVTAPILRTPTDDSITNNRYEQFSWTRSTCDTGVSHYNLYLDNIIVASHIAHSTAIDDIIYTTLTTPISDGEHTWYVIAYGSQGNSATSETHTFTVDATTPIIILLAVQKNTMYWATNDPYSIPPYDQRHLTVTNKNPLLSGKVEALSNLKLSLMRGSEPHKTITINDPDGEWEHRFYNLEPNITYLAYLSATDAAGNSNIFPTFTIQYTPIPILLRLIKDPEKGPTLRPAADIEPASGLQRPEVPPPPLPAQVLPPQKLGGPVIPAQAETYLIPLSLLTLLAHLAMTAFGAGIRPRLWPRLLYLLFFKKNPPLITILLYNPDNQKLIYTTLMDSTSYPNGFFLKATFPGYKPFTNLTPLQTPIVLKPKPSKTPLETLQNFSLTTRSLPLGLSLLTAVIHLIILPIPAAFMLFIAGSDLLYTQYIAPKTK